MSGREEAEARAIPEPERVSQVAAAIWRTMKPPSLQQDYTWETLPWPTQTIYREAAVNALMADDFTFAEIDRAEQAIRLLQRVRESTELRGSLRDDIDRFIEARATRTQEAAE